MWEMGNGEMGVLGIKNVAKRHLQRINSSTHPRINVLS